ncbi:unnamed protein product, partial [Brassica oleracea]
FDEKSIISYEDSKLKKTIETSNRRRFSWFTSGYLLSRNSKWYMILLVKTMASDAERFCRNTVKEPSDCSFLSLIFGSQGDTQKQLEK